MPVGNGGAEALLGGVSYESFLWEVAVIVVVIVTTAGVGNGVRVRSSHGIRGCVVRGGTGVIRNGGGSGLSQHLVGVTVWLSVVDGEARKADTLQWVQWGTP